MKQIQLYDKHNLSIFPLQPGSKKPLLPWVEFQGRRATVDEINDWKLLYPNCNWGVVAGKISNIAVVDVDGEKGHSAITEHGELPKTPTVQTARGRHYYFAYPEAGVATRTKVLPEVDIRGDGGYVVAPPSIHESGAEYRWLISPDEVPFAPMPQFLLGLLETPSVQNSNVSPVAAASGDVRRNVSASYQQEVEGLLIDLARSEEGHRNDTLNRTAFRLGQLAQAGALSEAWAQEQLESIGRSIGLPPAEITATIQSGFDAGLRKPAEGLAPIYQLLDEVVEVVDRPIRLIDGTAYGVASLPVLLNGTDGKSSESKLFVLTSDGGAFSEVEVPGCGHLDDLPVQVGVGQIPNRKKLLSPKGFQRFMAGDRPDPAAVFERLADCFDAFIAFESSKTDQRTMCEFLAAYCMGTYAFDAFDAVPYLWFTGERGSGKTQAAGVLAEVAFLGLMTMSGSTFPTIRDNADLGCFMVFDDLEAVDKLDSRTRDLILSGYSRGAVVQLKDPVGDGWEFTTINAFAPRAFTSIGDLDDVLLSRTIQIHLIATVDKEKSTRSPARGSDWPHDLPALTDDLWLTAVTRLPDIRDASEAVALSSTLYGRDDQIWRMPRAIAHWLENSHGVKGLAARFDGLAVSMTEAAKSEERLDNLVLTILACHRLLEQTGNTRLECPTADVARTVNTIGQEQGVFDQDNQSSSQQIGKLLSNLGFQTTPGHGKQRKRLITRSQVDEIAKARGIQLPDESPKDTDEMESILEF